MPDGALPLDTTAARFFDRIPADVLAGLTPEQKRAIAAVLGGRPGSPLPVNLRFSVPMLGWRFFFNVVAGHDRRSAERRQAERERHPVRTGGNFLFIVGGALAFYLIALICVLTWSSVVEF